MMRSDYKTAKEPRGEKQVSKLYWTGGQAQIRIFYGASIAARMRGRWI